MAYLNLIKGADENFKNELLKKVNKIDNEMEILKPKLNRLLEKSKQMM
jgi:hypothetical protein